MLGECPNCHVSIGYINEKPDYIIKCPRCNKSFSFHDWTKWVYFLKEYSEFGS